ncbi:MAG: cupin domain-containing protein [Crocinitomicaceae bacterium]|nr:cupin domain-containing protein [Crocinitomicaceae bacterium]MDG2464662.1 cupin domain-containing protein [Crocinitomicaceae bacterium]
MVPKEAQVLIDKLELLPHPEGGFYKETYRSEKTVGDRNVQTAIYFLITSHNISRFHRIKSDEIWFYHAGSPLSIHTLSKVNGHQVQRVGLDIAKGEVPQFLVPAETIFGSSLDVDNAFSLVSCTVAPGFDFADFELFTTEQLLLEFPDFEAIIRKMT